LQKYKFLETSNDFYQFQNRFERAGQAPQLSGLWSYLHKAEPEISSSAQLVPMTKEIGIIK
jgi:hypothetical protein